MKKIRKTTTTEKMLRVILRKRQESLGQACKAAGIAPANYYYHLKNTAFGEGKRGKKPKITMKSTQAKQLQTLLRRQENTHKKLNRLYQKVAAK